MTFQIRRASRGEAKPLVGLYAQSGAGKTWSSLLLARGFAGAGKVVMIETEGGRGEAYVDMIDGGYDVVSMRDDFSPIKYGQAISVAEAAKPDVLIIDSASHEWEGAGGVLDMAAVNQAKGVKGPLVWQRPKMDHSRHFMLRLLATPVPLVIVCMRAKYPMYEKRLPDGKKEWVRSEQLEPIQAADILYEMFVHGWIDVAQHRLHVTKLTRPDLAQVFLDNEPVTLSAGERLAAWARGLPATLGRVAATEPPGAATAKVAPASGGSLLSVAAMAREAAIRGREQLRAYCEMLKREKRQADFHTVTVTMEAELEALIPKQDAKQ